jgi:hypothetical protein
MSLNASQIIIKWNVSGSSRGGVGRAPIHSGPPSSTTNRDRRRRSVTSVGITGIARDRHVPGVICTFKFRVFFVKHTFSLVQSTVVLVFESLRQTGHLLTFPRFGTSLIYRFVTVYVTLFTDESQACSQNND